MKVAFIYRKSNYFLSGTHFDNCTYNLYYGALKRNPRIELDFVCDDVCIDMSIANNYDAVIVYDVTRWGGPDKFINVDKVKVPKICMIGDCHDAGYVAPGQTESRMELCKEFGFDCYFYQFPPKIFYKYYPKEWKYKWIPFGVEKSLYENVTPWNERIGNYILNTGAVNPKHYVLRGMLDSLPIVQHRSNVISGQSGDNFVRLLEQYKAAFAVMTTTTCHKQLEVPAAGCLSFMEVTEENGADIWGFENGVNAVYINTNNYKQILNDYIHTKDDPKWMAIANRGRQYVFANYSNDMMANWIIDMIEELI